MKRFLLTLVATSLLGLSVLLHAEDNKDPIRTVAAVKAEEFIGSTCVVTGKVAEVYANDKLVRLNFGDRFPKQTFTAVVFAAKTNLFSDLKKFEGKNLAITGKITEYREKPQIVINNTNQLTIIESK
jgi:ribosomal protein L35AE/L33A